MKEDISLFFLNKIKDKIGRGEFDHFLGPFLSREGLFSSIKARVKIKEETGGTPLLTEREINEAIKDAKEISAITFEIFKKIGIIEVDEFGDYRISKTGEKIVKSYLGQ